MIHKPDNSSRAGPVFPIAVGGVGGSGTRVVAEILHKFGYYLGDDLNPASDNLWFTLLFKRRELADASLAEIAQLTRIFTAAMSGGTATDPDTLALIKDLAKRSSDEFLNDWWQQRADTLWQALLQPSPARKWAWKEPNTHVFIDKLAVQVPGLRYIHVIRDGRDMAFSANKRQLGYWGDTIFGMEKFDPPLPSTALRYWRRVNERITQIKMTAAFPVLEVGFECLCEQPTKQILAIARFCGHPLSNDRANEIARECVRAPQSLERFRHMDHLRLDQTDCQYAEDTRLRLCLDLDASEPSLPGGK